MRCRCQRWKSFIENIFIASFVILNFFRSNRNDESWVHLLIVRVTTDFACLPILFFPDEIIVQKPELTSPSICHAPGGEYFVEGETWNIDSCTQCTCHSGRVLCETEVCPPLLCQNPTRTQDSCCPQCPGIHWQPAFIRVLSWSEYVRCVCVRLVVAVTLFFSSSEWEPAVLCLSCRTWLCKRYHACKEH